MKFESKTVHVGDRKKAGNFVPVTTPIYTASSYAYDSMDQLDRIFGREEQGPSYARYDNPTVSALQELVNELEGGLTAALRADQLVPSLSRAAVMSQAPETDGVFFKVPKVIER